MPIDDKINLVPAEAINGRFDRIENKIDKLSDAFITLARTEEKIVAIEADKIHIMERLNKHSEKLDQLQIEISGNTRAVSSITKMFWGVIIAVIGSVAAQYIKFGG